MVLDVDDRLCEGWFHCLPLLLIEHRDYFVTPPAIEILGHGTCYLSWRGSPSEFGKEELLLGLSGNMT